MHHRHAAVAHGDHLIEPARLEPRRHQEDVAAGVDALLQRPVEGQERRDLARDSWPPERFEHLVVARLAGAHHDQLAAQLRESARRRSRRSDRGPSGRSAARRRRSAGTSARTGSPASACSAALFAARFSRLFTSKLDRDVRIGRRDRTARCRCRSGCRTADRAGRAGSGRAAGRTPASGSRGRSVSLTVLMMSANSRPRAIRSTTSFRSGATSGWAMKPRSARPAISSTR